MLRLAFLITLVGMCSTAHSDLVQQFQIDSPNGTIVSDTLTLTLPGLIADGVTFDATLSVTGTAQGGGSGSLTQSSTGLGVAGAGSDLVSDGESLTFAMSVFNFIGGTVAFDGFTEIDFNNFGGSDSGVLSLDNSSATLVDNFFTTAVGAGTEDISGDSPTTFSAIAGTGALNSFRVDNVSGQFSGTAVPEPSSFLLLGLVSILACRRSRSLVQ